MKTKIEIKNLDGSLLFEFECEENTLHKTVEEAVRGYADLEGANLRYAYLEGADLRYAYLRGANLEGADLTGADLTGTHLKGANLEGTDLEGADHRYAHLEGAIIKEGIVLVGHRPLITIGPIGSESRTVFLWVTNKGAYVTAGCFFGTISQFSKKVEGTHEDNVHGQEYKSAIKLMNTHYKLWKDQK